MNTQGFLNICPLRLQLIQNFCGIWTTIIKFSLQSFTTRLTTEDASVVLGVPNGKAGATKNNSCSSQGLVTLKFEVSYLVLVSSKYSIPLSLLVQTFSFRPWLIASVSFSVRLRKKNTTWSHLHVECKDQNKWTDKTEADSEIQRTNWGLA